MITAGDRGYGAWRDGGLTIHDISDRAGPKLLSHINWSPPFPGGTHTPLPLPGRKLAVVADEANAETVRQGHVPHVRRRRARAGEPGADRHACPTPTDRDFCAIGNFGPHNLHENRPGSFRARRRSSRPTTTPACACSTSATQFAPKEIASWVPPAPAKLIDPRPNVALAAKPATSTSRPTG